MAQAPGWGVGLGRANYHLYLADAFGLPDATQTDDLAEFDDQAWVPRLFAHWRLTGDAGANRSFRLQLNYWQMTLGKQVNQDSSPESHTQVDDFTAGSQRDLGTSFTLTGLTLNPLYQWGQDQGWAFRLGLGLGLYRLTGDFYATENCQAASYKACPRQTLNQNKMGFSPLGLAALYQWGGKALEASYQVAYAKGGEVHGVIEGLMLAYLVSF